MNYSCRQVDLGVIYTNQWSHVEKINAWLEMIGSIAIVAQDPKNENTVMVLNHYTKANLNEAYQEWLEEDHVPGQNDPIFYNPDLEDWKLVVLANPGPVADRSLKEWHEIIKDLAQEEPPEDLAIVPEGDRYKFFLSIPKKTLILFDMDIVYIRKPEEEMPAMSLPGIPK